MITGLVGLFCNVADNDEFVRVKGREGEELKC